MGTISLDFSLVFDVIHHSLLLDNLKQYSITFTALKWMERYLTNIRQTVFFNGSLSKIRHVTCGVPQGSCLGHLLFSVFANDLPLVLEKALIAVYVDDSTIYAAESSVGKLNNISHEELTLVVEWITSNKLVINVGKQLIIMGSRLSVKS